MRTNRRYLLRTIAILLSLFNKVYNLSIQDAGSARNKGSSLSSTTTNPTTAGDLLVGGSSKRRRKKITADRRPSAPLVDSDLLRFLALQEPRTKLAYLDSLNIDSSTKTTEGIDQTMENITATSEVTITPQITERPSDIIVGDTSPSWLGQFNSHSVSLKLVALGVNRARADEAGDVVQRHALARTARRRVRMFLKERDTLWMNNGTARESQQRRISSTSSVLFSDKKETKLSSSLIRYNLDDVLDLLLDMGLTGNDIAVVLSHTPSVALMMPRRPVQIQNEGLSKIESINVEATVDDDDDSDNDERVETSGETLEETTIRAFKHILCDLLKLRNNDARKVLRSCPGLLTMRGSRSAEQVVNLLTKLGVSTKSIAKDKTSLPVLLSRSPSALFRLVAFLSSNAVRMKMKNIGPLLRNAACVPLLDAVAPVPRMDSAMSKTKPTTTKNDDPSEIESIVWGYRNKSELRRKQINDIYRNMSSTALALRHEIGTQDLGLVIATYPSVLLLDAKEQILPAASHLIKDLGIWEDDLPKVLQLFPTLLGMDIDQMELVASYLLSLEVDDQALGSIFRAFPKLLTLDVYKDMAPVVAFLRQIGITNVGRFITRLPPILCYSINELIPKWEYLSQVGLSSFELSRFPAYFSYPLDRVIKTRFEYLRYVKRIPTQLLALDVVLRHGDREFATKVARDTDDGKAFKEFADMRKRKAKTNNTSKRKSLSSTSKLKRKSQRSANRSSDSM